ncbi:aspartate kinase [Companilactobacillus zhachilii]|jgi:aspartate kinase|uniref:Aspartokinase n=1 Tax=Companilactobacillus zhachilii TaxID=2304606 RepID=A0A386PU68_9LACO|nr:aspartate kinase [Companilactobacillus zhachilii]AYE38648.1 aspartate kinase [Companilactobacillus zhachilii]MBL3532124.1 aspartate kinase [Companilactobacillus zhachilii]
MKVVKFGGSSLATGEQFEKVINIVSDDFERKVIVTSAPGKRFTGDTKVTDLLIEYANAVIENVDSTNIVKEIISRYREISDHFKLDGSVIKLLKDKLVNLTKTNFVDEKYLMAAFKAHGELLNAILLNSVLNAQGIKSVFIDPKDAGIIVHGQPNDADISPETYLNLDKLQLPNDAKVVFPGFFGYSQDGSIYTFSRGGSDITGALLSRGLHADLYENFTDVDAIYAANNHVVKHPQAIKKMSYREMRELSYAGFSVFQDEAIIPAVKGQVPVNVKNTNNPSAEGTLIVPEQFLFNPSNQITGIACSKRFSALYIHRYLLNKEVGFTLKLLQIFYKYNISYEHMPSGIDDLTVIFDRSKLDKTTIKHLCHDVKEILQPDYLEWIDDYAIIMVVGEGIAHNVNTLGEIIDSLTKNNIAIHMINQGASRISIMIGIQESDADEAVKQIYKTFFN